MQTQIIDVTLLSERDAGYRAHRHGWAAQRPVWRGPRAAGEVIGGQVEQAARHCIGKQVPLQTERILRWRQRERTGRYEARYREIDAVHAADDGSLCLYEIKLTTPVRMKQAAGLAQLTASASLLVTGHRHPQIRYRLVYIAEQPLPVKRNLPAVSLDDLTTGAGVIWLAPDVIAAAARELEIPLPADWMEPAARSGPMIAPENDWQRFADVEITFTQSLARAFKQALPAC